MTEIRLNPPTGSKPPVLRPATDDPACIPTPTDRATIGASPSAGAVDRAALLAAVGQSTEQPADHVVELTDATLDDFLKNAKTPVFLEFYNPT